MVSVSAKQYKKKDKKEEGLFGILPSSGSRECSLVPGVVYYYLMFVALTLPNIIFSGIGFFDTLHIMKWVFAMVPVGLVTLWGGISLGLYGPERTSFKLDMFGWIWLMMLGYISLQPLWCDIISWSAFMKEWFFFATLVATYIFCYNLFKDSGYHKLALWFGNINAAINIVFAELLIRNLNGPFPFIMNVPGNYIGNTGQQNMFGLWIAMSAFNSIYLNVAYSAESDGSKKYLYLRIANFLLLAFNAWGLWNSTTRCGTLALLTATILFSIVTLCTGRKKYLLKIVQAVAIIFIMLGLNLATGYFGWSRSYQLINKTMDMFLNGGTDFGGRIGIWRTSISVCEKYPVKGVGIGQFKWHYLEGQKDAMRKHPDMEWQFTYWAHCEYMQWWAEFGLFGILLLIFTGLWWLWSLIRALTQRKQLSLEATWACGILFLIFTVAVFSRPFHRIEDSLWIAWAFATVNRELLPYSFKWCEIKNSAIYRLLGGFIACVAVVGFVFLCNGLRGDQFLHRAVMTQNAGLQRYLIGEALKQPMTRDEAEEQYAYHLLAVARVTRKIADWNEGINQLYQAFLIRPQAKQLLDLVNLASQTHNQALLAQLVPYLKPGTFNAAPPVSQTAPRSADGK